MDSLLAVCSTASVGRRRDDWELEESILFRDDDDDDDDDDIATGEIMRDSATILLLGLELMTSTLIKQESAAVATSRWHDGVIII